LLIWGLDFELARAAELLIPATAYFKLQDVNSRIALLHPKRKKTGTYAGRESRMLWTVFVILLLLWLLGWGFHVAGSLIHLILVIALVVLVIELITGRRATV
jgi:hypothetical protein